jgi:RHS repeat-associated protein
MPFTIRVRTRPFNFQALTPNHGTSLLHTTTDALGNVSVFSYDAQGNADTETRTVTVVDASGGESVETLVSDYDYDAKGRLERMVNPARHETSYEYDENGNRTLERTTRTDADGTVHLVVKEREYDANDRLVRTWNAANPRSVGGDPSSETVYNAIGKPWKTYDALRRVTERLYDDRGELWKTIHPDGTSEQTLYDAAGRPEYRIDRRGYSTQTVYDSMGRVAETRFHGDAGAVRLSSTQYDAAGRVWRSIDARDNVTTSVYDDAGRRVAMIDALGRTTSYEYDDAGNVRFVTDPKLNVIEHVYDDLNRRVRTIFPASSVWTGSGYQTIATATVTGYDELGRRVSMTDQSGLTTRYVYDTLGRLDAVVQPAASNGGARTVSRYTYDELGNQLTQTDARNRTTRFGYDNLGRRVTRTMPLGQTETVQYDAVGNMRYRTDFNGRTTEYQYDSMNRLRFRIPDAFFSGEPTVEWTYTASGRRETMTDATGTTTYFYDDRDRLETVQRPEGTLGYGWDAASNLKSITSGTAGAAYMGYTYDVLNRLGTVIDANSEVTTYGYDLNGNLETVALPTGVTATYGYNAVNRLESLVHTKNLATLVSYGYGLNPTGHRRETLEGSAPSEPTRSVTYTYDDLWRLKSETIANDPGGNNGTATYLLDAVGNRELRTSVIPGLPGQTFTYDANDRVNGDATDASGNTLSGNFSQPTAQSPEHIRGTDSYDSFDRLIRRTGSEGSIEITYNGDGHKVRESVAKGGITTTTTYLVDELNPTGYAQVLEENTNGSPTAVYTYGHDLISMDRVDGNGIDWRLTYYGYDGHGSVRFLTDELGAITDTYNYDAFGELLSSTGTTDNAYRYCGEQLDAALGLYYLRARHLNAPSGRFWTMDGYEGRGSDPASLHKYAYAGADPVNGADPSGYISLSDVSATQKIALTLGAIGAARGGYGAYRHGGNVLEGAVTGFTAGYLATYVLLRWPPGVWIAIPGGVVMTVKEFYLNVTEGKWDLLGIDIALLLSGPKLTRYVSEIRVVDPPPVAPRTPARLEFSGAPLIQGELKASALLKGELSIPIYRLAGGDAPVMGRSWTGLDPRSFPSIDAFKQTAGIGSWNTGETLVIGRLKSFDGAVGRTALPIEGIPKPWAPEIRLNGPAEQMVDVLDTVQLR